MASELEITVLADEAAKIALDLSDFRTASPDMYRQALGEVPAEAISGEQELPFPVPDEPGIDAYRYIPSDVVPL